MPVADKRLVVCTPAGRRRYLEVLARYVLAEPAVDEWQLWANTTCTEDLRWMGALSGRDPRVTVVSGNWPAAGTDSIHKFFPACTDPSTVYVRLDDDVVFAEPGAIVRLAARRLDEPDPFLLFGNVYNNALVSHLHQRLGRLTTEHGLVGYDCMDAVGWNDGAFAIDTHRRFLADPDPEHWRLPDWNLSWYERFSINVFAWTGDAFATFGGRVGRDEEDWLSVQRPKEIGRPSRMAGDCFFSHYAFFTQREAIDAAVDVLAGYRRLAGLDE